MEAGEKWKIGCSVTCRIMKIVVHDYGGYEFPLELSRELALRGEEVTHLYVNFLRVARGDFKEGIHEGGLTVKSVPMNPSYERNKYSFPKRFLMNLGYAFRLLKVILEEHPDVVLSGNTPTEIQLPLALLCRLSGVRFVNWVQDFFSVAVARVLSKKMGRVGNLLGAIYEYGDRMVIHSANCSVLITEDFRKQLGAWRMNDCATTVIPNWASIEKFPVIEQVNSWSSATGMAGKFVFLYSGTLGLKHDPAALIALANEFTKDPDVVIMVVAEGAGAAWLEGEVRKNHQSNLKVLPYQPPSDVPLVIASASVLVALLEKDAGEFSVPSKVLTYLCSGRPVLLSVPLSNLAASIVVDHEAGLAAAPGNMEDFLSAARRLRESPDLCSRLGCNARAYAEANFPIGCIADRFETALAPKPTKRGSLKSP